MGWFVVRYTGDGGHELYAPVGARSREAARREAVRMAGLRTRVWGVLPCRDEEHARGEADRLLSEALAARELLYG